MLRQMLLGDHQVDTVSVSSLLNKPDKMPIADSPPPDTVTVKETSITVQESVARANDDTESIADRASSRAAALTDSPASKIAAELPHRDGPPVAELETARAVADEKNGASNAVADDQSAQTKEEVLASQAPPAQTEKDAPDVKTSSNKSTPKARKLRAPEEEKPKPKAKGKAKEQDGDKAEDSVPEPAPASAPATEDNVFEIDRLATHRVNKESSTVDFYVEWVGTATSWEPERELQAQVPDLVFEYWDAQGGREKATGLEEFHVFRILDSTVDPLSYRIQWVGYRDTPADTTWEKRSLLQKVAPLALGIYESSNKKRTTKGRPGRPSKKAKTTRNSKR
jgi:hypothetical protein